MRPLRYVCGIAVLAAAIGCGKANPLWGMTDGGDAPDASGAPTTSDGSVSTSGTSTLTSGPSSQSTTSTASTTLTNSTGASGSTGDATTSSGSTGTSTNPTPCSGSLVAFESFDQLPDEPPWDNIGNPGTMIPTPTGGELRLVAAIQQGGNPATWNLEWGGAMPDVGSIGWEVIAAPTSASVSQLYVGLQDQTNDRYYVEFYDGNLRGTRFQQSGNIYTSLAALPFDPVEHRWFRITFDSNSAQVGFDVSPDGSSWTNFVAPFTAQLDFGSDFAVFYAGTTVDPLMQNFATIDNVFVCDLS